MATDAACRSLAKALSRYRAAFAEAISGIEPAAHRDWYAQVILNRLLLIYDLQVAGFLGQGDRWYLHTQLGRCQQRSPDRFFMDFFLPLCHQGLGLPEVERSLPVQEYLGQVPYLGGRLLQKHFLEEAYPHLSLPDEPYEAFLGWLAEQTWHRSAATSAADGAGEAVTRTTLAAALEYLITEKTDKANILSPATLKDIRDRTVDAYLLKQIQPQRRSVASIEALLASLDASTCRFLVGTVLPATTVLDPACGSGRLLGMAANRLAEVYQACWTWAIQTADRALQGWLRSQLGTAPTVAWAWQAKILAQNLFGVDLSPAAIETTQLQLWLTLVATAHTVEELAPLPDLDFNITTGNALVGFIQVNRESFDQILPKHPKMPPPAETVLQGNLLQPLTAASYQETLTERQIRIEHYRGQTQAIAEAGDIPEYVQTEFLRDRIDEVNQSAQQKLDRLLLETFSQKLGIRIREPHLSGRTHKRLVTADDIAALCPFYWGFFFHAILEKRGGFEVILTHPPRGTLRPNADEFYTHHEPLFQQYKIARTEFRRSRRQVLQQVPELAKRWATYAGRFSCLNAYFRRSQDYALPPTATRSLPFKTLFTQRCQALLSANGVPPYIHGETNADFSTPS